MRGGSPEEGEDPGGAPPPIKPRQRMSIVCGMFLKRKQQKRTFPSIQFVGRKLLVLKMQRLWYTTTHPIIVNESIK